MKRDLESISNVINAITDDVNALIQDGELYAIEGIVLAKKLENAAKQIRKDWEQEALTVTESWKGQSFGGFVATQKDGAKRYSYKHIAEWQELDEFRKKLEQASKDAFIQAQIGNIIVDSDGVLVPQADPVKTKQSIVLTKVKS